MPKVPVPLSRINTCPEAGTVNEPGEKNDGAQTLTLVSDSHVYSKRGRFRGQLGGEARQ